MRISAVLAPVGEAGPRAFGVIRPDLGLNATAGGPLARPGRLALIAQSSAVCAAMLDFALPNEIGFAAVIGIIEQVFFTRFIFISRNI